MMKHDRLHDLVKRFVMARKDAELTDEALDLVAGGDGTAAVTADASPAMHKMSDVTLKRGSGTAP